MTSDELLDKKILFQHYPVNKFTVIEGKVKEFSPTGKCVKIDNDWYVLNNIKFLEIFSDKERPSMTFKANNE